MIKFQENIGGRTPQKVLFIHVDPNQKQSSNGKDFQTNLNYSNEKTRQHRRDQVIVLNENDIHIKDQQEKEVLNVPPNDISELYDESIEDRRKNNDASEIEDHTNIQYLSAIVFDNSDKKLKSQQSSDSNLIEINRNRIANTKKFRDVRTEQSYLNQFILDDGNMKYVENVISDRSRMLKKNISIGDSNVMETKTNSRRIFGTKIVAVSNETYLNEIIVNDVKSGQNKSSGILQDKNDDRTIRSESKRIKLSLGNKDAGKNVFGNRIERNTDKNSGSMLDKNETLSKNIRTDLKSFKRETGNVGCRKDVFEKGIDHKIDQIGTHRIEPVRKFECTLCSRRFAQKQTLMQHMLTHTGQRPFSCTVCGKSFTQRGALVRHQKIHNDVRDNVCPICDFSFRQKVNLKRHIQLHEGTSKVFACNICGRTFSRKLSLVKHYNVHRKRRYTNCWSCKRQFFLDKNSSTGNGTCQRFTCAMCKNRYERVVRSSLAKDNDARNIDITPYCLKCVPNEDANYDERTLGTPHWSGTAWKDGLNDKNHRLFTCAVCDKTYGRVVGSSSSKEDHTWIDEDGEVYCLKCVPNDRVNYEEYEWDDETLSNTSRTSFIPRHYCPECTPNIGKKKNTHTKLNKTFSCKLCDDQFHSLHVLKNHYLTHRKDGHDIDECVKTYSCYFCTDVYVSRMQIRCHLKKHETINVHRKIIVDHVASKDGTTKCVSELFTNNLTGVRNVNVTDQPTEIDQNCSFADNSAVFVQGCMESDYIVPEVLSADRQTYPFYYGQKKEVISKTIEDELIARDIISRRFVNEDRLVEDEMERIDKSEGEQDFENNLDATDETNERDLNTENTRVIRDHVISIDNMEYSIIKSGDFSQTDSDKTFENINEHCFARDIISRRFVNEDRLVEDEMERIDKGEGEQDFESNLDATDETNERDLNSENTRIIRDHVISIDNMEYSIIKSDFSQTDSDKTFENINEQCVQTYGLKDSDELLNENEQKGVVDEKTEPPTNGVEKIKVFVIEENIIALENVDQEKEGEGLDEKYLKQLLIKTGEVEGDENRFDQDAEELEEDRNELEDSENRLDEDVKEWEDDMNEFDENGQDLERDSYEYNSKDLENEFDLYSESADKYSEQNNECVVKKRSENVFFNADKQLAKELQFINNEKEINHTFCGRNVDEIEKENEETKVELTGMRLIVDDNDFSERVLIDCNEIIQRNEHELNETQIVGDFDKDIDKKEDRTNETFEERTLMKSTAKVVTSQINDQRRTPNECVIEIVDQFEDEELTKFDDKLDAEMKDNFHDLTTLSTKSSNVHVMSKIIDSEVRLQNERFSNTALNVYKENDTILRFDTMHENIDDVGEKEQFFENVNNVDSKLDEVDVKTVKILRVTGFVDSNVTEMGNEVSGKEAELHQIQDLSISNNIDEIDDDEMNENDVEEHTPVRESIDARNLEDNEHFVINVTDLDAKYDEISVEVRQLTRGCVESNVTQQIGDEIKGEEENVEVHELRDFSMSHSVNEAIEIDENIAEEREIRELEGSSVTTDDVDAEVCTEDAQIHRRTGCPFFCYVCKTPFHSGPLLHKHFKLAHTNGPEIRCNLCSKTFQHKGALKKHLVLHLPHDFKCAYCPKTFNRKDALSSHESLHLKQNTFECGYCNAKYYIKQSLYSHIQIKHADRKSHVCDFCLKAFALKSSLTKHYLVHTNERNHACFLCDKKFKQKTHLDVHLASHEELKHKMKRFECEVCGKVFHRKSDRERHALRHDKKRILYPCGRCGKVFKRERTAEKHAQNGCT